MNNLELTAVIAIAVAQILTILLTIGRERDIKELRKFVNELSEIIDKQGVRIVELKAWLAGRYAAQPGRIRSEREPIREPIANDIEAPEPAITRSDTPDAMRLSTIEDGLKRAANAISWRKVEKAREIVAAHHTPEKIGPTTKPITMLEIHTAQEVDAEVLEMQRLGLPVTPGEERNEAYYRLTFKKQGNAEALQKFDDALKKMGTTTRGDRMTASCVPDWIPRST
jgi:hypothetical protein